MKSEHLACIRPGYRENTNKKKLAPTYRANYIDAAVALLPLFLAELADKTFKQRYKVEKLIGRGNDGTVHLATDQRTLKPVAVRLFPYDLDYRPGVSDYLKQIAGLSTLSS